LGRIPEEPWPELMVAVAGPAVNVGGFQQDFPVVEDGLVVGVLRRNDLAAALARHGPETRVGAVMQREFVTASPREMLQTAFARLQEGHCRTVPVAKDGCLLGLLTADNLAEVLMIQQALEEARRPAIFGGPRPSNRSPSSPSR
jgi:CBS domain-containing protein